MDKSDSKNTEILNARPAAPGIAIGNAWILPSEKIIIRPGKIKPDETDFHIAKTEKAFKDAEQKLRNLKNQEVSNTYRDIADTQIQILSDPELKSQIKMRISEQNFGAVYSVFSSFNDYIQLLETSGVPLMQERSIDVVSLRDMVIQAIENKSDNLSVPDGAVVFAHEISPTQMFELSKFRVGGIVLQKGGLTSHAVILAQSLGIPCVVGALWSALPVSSGITIALDAYVGEVFINPDKVNIAEIQRRIDIHEKGLMEAGKWVKKDNKTQCGTSFTLRGNIEFLEELPRLATNGATGVGLLRTEALFLKSKDFDVKTQMEFYGSVLKATGREQVTIRLFDAGGDKLFGAEIQEDNPFLGWRGVRMLLDKPDLLERQLEAILRISSSYPGKIRILIPMVSTLEEISRVKEHFAKVQKQLKKEGQNVDESIPVGIMIEVPSMCILADSAAKMVDFFSIGTNDLTQYTLAVDRGNERISGLFQNDHPAVWKLMNMSIQAAESNGIPVAVCGEMAGRPEYAAFLLGMGVREFSMNPASVPFVKSLLCKQKIDKLIVSAEKLLTCSTSTQVREILNTLSGDTIGR
jgi:phosphotransferase system enzyme I (PtsI)